MRKSCCNRSAGSTNGLIHLTAMAHVRRTGSISGSSTRSVARCRSGRFKPSGEHYMEHFHHAGGMPKLLAQLGDLIDLDAKTIHGPDATRCRRQCRRRARPDAIRPRSNPIKKEGGLAVLHGNLAPRGAVIKQSAASASCCSTPGARWCSNPSRT